MVRYLPPLGAKKFIELEDTPSSYSDKANKGLAVNADANGIRFFDMDWRINFGPWLSRGLNIDHDEGYDGFVVAAIRVKEGAAMSATLRGLVDGVEKAYCHVWTGHVTKGSICFPVKKGEVWKAYAYGDYEKEYCYFIRASGWLTD